MFYKARNQMINIFHHYYISGEVRLLALRLRLAAVAAPQVEAGPRLPAQPLRRQVPVCDAPLRRRAGGTNAQRNVEIPLWLVNQDSLLLLWDP